MNSLTIIHLIILRLFSFHHYILLLKTVVLEGKINKPNVTMRRIGAYICNCWITKGVIVFLDVYTASN